MRFQDPNQALLLSGTGASAAIISLMGIVRRVVLVPVVITGPA